MLLIIYYGIIITKLILLKKYLDLYNWPLESEL